jgi:hypothetical protein
MSDIKIQRFLKKHTTPFEKNFDTTNLMKRLGNQVFKFGKYKGETYEYVWNENKGYVAWILGRKNKPQERYMKDQMRYYEWMITHNLESSDDDSLEVSSGEEE